MRTLDVETRTFFGSDLDHERFCFDQNPKRFSIRTLRLNENPKVQIGTLSEPLFLRVYEPGTQRAVPNPELFGF